MEARSDAAAHAWQQAFVHAPGARVNWTADATGARRALDWGAGGPWHLARRRRQGGQGAGVARPRRRARVADLEFELNQIVSQVAVEYLTTYQNIGAAYCRLDGGELVRLDGLVADSRTSHERTSTLSTTARGGRHQLSCISDGQKFKITRVVCTPPQMCDQEAAR